MSDSVELVIIGSQEKANQTAEGIPIIYKNIHTANEFRVYFNDLHAFVSILLLFFNSSDQIIHSILKESKRRKSQIIRVLICNNANDHFVNSMHIRCVSEQLVKYKIKSTIAQFIDRKCRKCRKCMKQYNLINPAHCIALYHQRTQILEQFHTNDKLEACHILLIPLNATSRDVHNAEQRLKNICYDLYGDEYEFVIRKLSDYIPEDENNPGKSSCTAFLEQRYRGEICDTIMKLSFIRMYVVGNELYISNKWSQKLAALELDINRDHNLKYVERCSFIINRPVHPQFTGNLVPIFGRVWQMQVAVAKTLDTIRDDIEFQDILPRIHGCRENREMYINSKSYQQSLLNSGDMTRFSNEIRSIEQARSGPEEKQDTGDITKTIWSNFR